MAIPYYRWFPGDYARDTRHLSLMQHGAYRLLLDLYMDSGGPLRNDLGYLHRWLHAESVEEKQAVEFILTEFFLLTEIGWRHKRCDAELKWRAAQSEIGKQAAEARWNAFALRSHCDRYANQNQNQSSSIVTSSKSNKGSRLGATETAIEIPLIGDKSIAVCADYVAELEKLYPGVDVLQTLREIRGWNLANPTRRKTARGIARHINSWMEREQNGA